MFTFILVVQAIIAAALVTVVLMQRSEGGGLGVGGSPSGLMSARGAADFLTRTTTILATLFVALSIVLAVIASVKHAPGTIDTSLQKSGSAVPTGGATPGAPAQGDPLAGAAASVASNASGAAPAAPAASNGAVPLQK